MTIEQMRERKQELGYTYEQIADLSGVPLGTVQKVFGGVTASPRYDTLRALEQVFQKKEPMYVKESALPYEAEARREKRQGEYTVED
ncbi:helix-turn-helix domain-containing protein, partial [Mediterraneibacter glycyrrhizinilyticus]|uniref:helix-turn-helix domain-containing protein n=1 Tax=Mediterraneibacter glycyrrhizinilyticus TaxID=342942 RepID=UPI00189EEE29